MSTGVTVQCTVEERAKSEDFLITLELTSYDYEPAELAVNLKIAIWIKLMVSEQMVFHTGFSNVHLSA